MRLDYLGCPVDLIGHEEILCRVRNALQGGGRMRIEGLNVAKLIEARENPLLNDALRVAELVHVDGFGIEAGLRLSGHKISPRRAGIDLMDDLCGLAVRTGAGIYLLGAAEEVVQKTVVALSARHPELLISGYRNGFFCERDELEIVRLINESGAQLLFIGISSPKKELFLRSHWNELRVRVAMGVGGSYDVLSGELRRAPHWMRGAGLEWMFRLIQEPRRLFMRYARTNMKFLLLLIGQKLGFRSSRRRGC